MPIPPPTDRLTFREMTPADEPLMATLLGDPEVMWVYPAPFDADRIRRWIAWNLELYERRGFGLWLLHDGATGEFVGECGLVEQDVQGAIEVEVGYQLRTEFWGRGLATEAVTACRDHARDVVGLERLVALIDPRNVPSQHVAANAGLALEREVQLPTKMLGVWAIDLRRGATDAAGGADAAGPRSR
jgi:RimJ/RimL family protein N-acetyltransferase